MAYTKLAQSILTSTIWMEDDKTRIVWMTLLAMADQNGEVQASIPGLAHIARVSTESCREAIAKFLSPDPDSRTKDDEGRRIEEIRGGWLLINHGHYRDLASNDDQKRKAAERQQRWRDKLKRNASVTDRNASVTQNNTASRPIPHTDADADADADAVAASAACTEPGVPASVPAALVETVMIFPVNRSSRHASDEWVLTGDKVDEWMEVYPHLDVVQQCRMARQWVIDNPSRRKTGGGMLTFLNKWLARSQNNGSGGNGNGQIKLTANQQREANNASSFEIFRRAAAEQRAEQAAAAARIDCGGGADRDTGAPLLGETNGRADTASNGDLAGQPVHLR